MTDVRFPIGRFEWPAEISPAKRELYVEKIAATPKILRDAVAGLTSEQLDTPYREGGWTVRQVVHHLPDSHMNSFIRFKLALTEDNPVIKPYDEAAWARLGDTAAPAETSLVLLESLHERWLILMRGLGEDDWKKEFRHPERGSLTLERNLALYAWHGDHHIAHITRLRTAKGW